VSGVLVSKEKNLLLGGFSGIFPFVYRCCLGYRRPAACNTELRVLLIVIYNVGHCF
jgi:hypothetical protein